MDMTKKMSDPLDNIINKVYVINLKNRTDRWTDINKNFAKTGLKLTRWDATYGKDLSEDEIKNVTTPFSREICSPSMIGCWLSHYNVWKNIVKNKETNVLIMEDDAYPVNDFTTKLHTYWKEVPDNWDIVYLGCIGTCSDSYVANAVASILTFKTNKPIYKNGIKCKYTYNPGFPLALHGYMITYEGAKKLINDPKLKKVQYHIDVCMALHAAKNKNFNVYAINPHLIYQDAIKPRKKNYDILYSNNITSNHPIINDIKSALNNNEYTSLEGMLEVVAMHNRRTGLEISGISIVIFVISLIVGMVGNMSICKYYLIFIIAFYLIELNRGKYSVKKLKNLGFELVIIIILLFVGYKSRKYVSRLRKGHSSERM